MSENKSNFKSIGQPAIVLTVIALVTAFLLALTNMVTAPIIAQQGDQKELAARQEVLPTAATFTEKQGEQDGTTFDYLEGTDASGTVVGYIFTNQTPGYGGPVIVMMGVDTEGKLTGVQPLELKESPGYGMNAQEPGFLDQFKGKSGEIKYNKTAASDTEVLAISGATVTTAAFVNSVNAGMQQFATITGGSLGADPKLAAVPGAATLSEPVTGTYEGTEFTYYHAFDEAGTVLAYVIEAKADGFAVTHEGPQMTVAVGLDLEGVIVGSVMTDNKETPGIGDKVNDETFTQQFVGKQGEIASIDAISGSTFSSKGYQEAVNLALKYFSAVEAPKDPKLANVPGSSQLSEAMSGTLDGAAFTYYEAQDADGAVVGYIFENEAIGYHKETPFKVQVGVDATGKITGTTPIDLNETPGIGMQVGEDAFRQTFIGVSGDASTVDIISQATVSSEAYIDAVNLALQQFAAVSGGAN